MSGKYYLIDFENVITSIANALTDKYGAYDAITNPTGYTELHKDASYLIFSCPSIAGNRVIRIYWLSGSSQIQFQWGTSYSTGTTIVNGIDFAGTYTSVSAIEAIHLVLHPETFFLATSGVDRAGNKTVIIGQLSNGEYGVIGIVHSNYASSTWALYRNYNVTTNKKLKLTPLFLRNMYTATNKIYTQKICLVDDSSEILLTDNDSNLIYFLNVLNVAYGSDRVAPSIGNNYIMSGAVLYQETTVKQPTSFIGNTVLFSEFTPEE